MAQSQSNPATAIANLFKTPELKSRIGFTLLCLVVYRVGAHITAPGIDVQALLDFFKSQQGGGLLGLYDLFVAQARAVHPEVAAGIFAADMKVHLVNDGPVTIPLQIS